MKTNYCILPSIILLFTFTNCSSSDEYDTIDNTDGRRMYHLTVSQVDDADSSRAGDDLTRAILTEDNKKLSSLWEQGDYLTYCNVTSDCLYQQIMNEQAPLQGKLSAVSHLVTTSQFIGDVTLKKGDYLALVYPKTSFTFKTDKSVSFIIPLTCQDGTLDKIAKSYHYQYGLAGVVEADDATRIAKAEANMKSLLTVCKFSFVDINDNEEKLIPIDKLEISYGGTGSDGNKYPEEAIVVIDNNLFSDVHAEPKSITEPLSVSVSPSADNVYVALLPTGGTRTFYFTVTSGNKIFKGEASANLKEGKFVKAPKLKLAIQQ